MVNEIIEPVSVYRDIKKEKIDGKIYLMATPSDEHRDVQGNLSMIFNNYFRQNKKRCVARFEAHLNMDINNYFEPDLMVFCYEHSRHIPLIVIEVLSKSTRGRDLGVKMEKYAQLGIKEYWIITWELLTVDIYLLGEGNKYELYKSYAYFTVHDTEIKRKEDIEIITEFSPLSIPELNVKLEDVFYFVE